MNVYDFYFDSRREARFSGTDQHAAIAKFRECYPFAEIKKIELVEDSVDDLVHRLANHAGLDVPHEGCRKLRKFTLLIVEECCRHIEPEDVERLEKLFGVKK